MKLVSVDPVASPYGFTRIRWPYVTGKMFCLDTFPMEELFKIPGVTSRVAGT